ncbi:MAG: YceI family protein [Myxococcota bacterium]|nr:YceI family protein [Myxococcota bacterium]
MKRHDADSAEVRVFTYKEGLLSAVAHDLQLEVTRFEIEVGEDRAIAATFDPRSIRVLDAMVDGRLSPGTLGAKDKEKIQGNIVKDVIPVRKHPEIRFESTEVREVDAGWEIRGKLTLAGRTRDITVPVHRDDGHWIGEVSIHQPDWGIKPYSAMLGALKLQPGVKVRVRVPAE